LATLPQAPIRWLNSIVSSRTCITVATHLVAQKRERDVVVDIREP